MRYFCFRGDKGNCDKPSLALGEPNVPVPVISKKMQVIIGPPSPTVYIITTNGVGNAYGPDMDFYKLMFMLIRGTVIELNKPLHVGGKPIRWYTPIR